MRPAAADPSEPRHGDGWPCDTEVVRWLLFWALGLAVAACYSPAYRDCEISCANGTCPSGLECTAGACRLPGMTTPCSEIHEDDAGVDAKRELALENLREAQLTALCSYYVRCGAAEALQTCVESFSNSFLPVQALDYRNQIAAVAAGKVVYHSDKAEECLAALENLSCDRMSTAGPLACQEIFSGTAGAGDVCAIAEECVSQFCMTTTCNNGCCTGTCMGATPPGMKNLSEPCTYRDRCSGGYCDTATGTCAAFKAPGTGCTQTAECGTGYICRTTGSTSMTCEMPSPTLGVCNSTSDCKLLSDVCSAGKCQTGGLTGFSCPTGTECQTFHPCTSGACTIPPAIGEACPNNVYCRTGYCSGNPAMCVARIADGLPCDVARGGQDCESGLCDSATMKCAARPVCF